MVEYRLTQILIVATWLASMAWLVTTKIAPAERDFSAPNYAVFDSEADSLPDNYAWRIECNGQPTGTASTTLIRTTGLPPVIQSEVSLDRMPAGKFLTQLSGIWPILAKASGLPSENFELSLRIRTRLHFDEKGKLDRLTCDVDLDDVADLVRIEGDVLANGRLRVRAFAGEAISAASTRNRLLLERVITLHPDALIIDGFVPHPRWSNLRVGQSWLVKSLRPLSPSDPIQTLRARVVREQLVPWDNELESMHVVEFEDMRQVGITKTQEPMMRMWVRNDGSVARQQLFLGGLTIEFFRVPFNHSIWGELP